MISSFIQRGSSCTSLRVRMLCVAVSVVLLLGLVPHQAFAYYNRGSVALELGTTSLSLQAGASVDVSVSITPSSDDQTEGCGMPLCPQGCSSSCADENGQCTCGGTEYTTYYATASAVSSDTSVAVAVYDNGVLTVYGRSEGEAVITVTASLRQFTDDSVTLTVQVEGEVEGYQASTTNSVDLPSEAQVTQDDRQDVVEKTVMGRRIINVRITDDLDTASWFSEMAGVDGDLIFWEGDTYYQPNYSLTFTGTDFEADDVSDLDVRLDIAFEAEGTLNQFLADLSDFVIVEFSETDVLPAAVEVYVNAQGVFADGEEVALFSYDEDSKTLVREEVEVEVVGGYLRFTVAEGKAYAVSSRDLVTEAATAINDDNVQSTLIDATESQPLLAPFVLGAAVVAVAIVALVLMVRHRRHIKEG